LSNIIVQKRTEIVKQKASEAGFDFCGIAKSEKLEEHTRQLEEWLNKNYHGKMAYMANHFDKRLDPTKLVPGSKSVVTLIHNYYPGKSIRVSDGYKIAKYAYGKDYHYVIKQKLRALLESLREAIGDINGRVFVDSAPVMERQWAAKSGLGWQGKNTLLLNRQLGSFFFLAELIIDLELEPDGPVKDYCGTCTRCLDACPTDAFPRAGVLDASKCISYLTIELKDEIPDEFRGKMDDWIFGCDICQDVCPWNRFSKPHSEPEFDPPEALQNFNKQEWEELTEEVFNAVFKHSPLKRTGYSGMKRNVGFVKKSL